MQSVLIVIHILIVIALVAVVLLQRSEGGVARIGRRVRQFHDRPGPGERAVARHRRSSATLFFATSILMSIIAGWSRTPHSILERARRAGEPDRAPAGQLRQHSRSAEAASGPVERAVRAGGPPPRPRRADRSPRPPAQGGRRRLEACRPSATSAASAIGAEQMFDLVADVERYPEFVPLCKSLRVRSRAPDAQGRETLIADMSVGYKMIRERSRAGSCSTSRACGSSSNISTGRSATSRTSGPFATSRSGRRSLVTFFIDYEFRSRTLGALMGSMFDAAFRKFAQAFEERGRRDLRGEPCRRTCALLTNRAASGRAYKAASSISSATPDRGEAHIAPADCAEPHFARDRRRAAPGTGEPDEADRLFRRSALRSRDAGDADRDIGARGLRAPPPPSRARSPR